MDAIVYDKVGKEAENVRDALYGIYPQATITDAAIATFDDGADSMPVKKLVANIEPVQDLHGYDNPWPAGGGKNKANVPDVAQTTRDGLTYRIQNGILYINGTYTGSGLLLVSQSASLEENQYTFSVQLLGGTMSGTKASFNGYNSANERKWLVAWGASVASVSGTATGDIVSYSVSINTGITFTNAVIGFQIEANSEMTSFAPYSNICPISGWTGANLQRTGKNLFDPNSTGNEWVNSSLSIVSRSAAKSCRFRVSEGQKVVLSNANTASSDNVLELAWLDNGGNVISRETRASQYNFITGTAPAGAVGVIACFYTWAEANNAQFEYAGTFSDYEPYTGSQLSVTFPTEAGTVYGGTLTVNPDRTGTLVVDRAMVDLGTLTPSDVSYNGRQINYNQVNPTPNGYLLTETDLRCNRYKPSLYSSEFNNLIFFVNTSILRIMSSVGLGSTEQEVRAYFQQNPCHVVYKISNPQTIPMTVSEISAILTTLYGTNNIWADTGDIEKLTYRADLGKYIDSHITTAVANALNA